VASVAGVARETLDRFFEWVEEPEEAEESDPPVTDATSATPYGSQQTELAEALEPSRLASLAVWYRGQIKELRAEMSPATLKVHLEQKLRVTLAELVQESVLDTEIGRVVKAANKAARAKP
jgi:hypothetical protein